VLFAAQKFDAAFKDIDALIDLAPSYVNRLGYVDGDARMRDFHIVALAERASMFEELAKYDRAEQDLNAAVTYLRSTESLTARAEFLVSRPDRLQDALVDLEEATALDQTYRVAFYTKGLVLGRLRRFDEAYTALDRAVELAPNNAFGLLMRGKMQQALGRSRAAAEDVLSAMMISPQVTRWTLGSLRHAGYWISRDDPRTVTPELRDAVQACMMDPMCN
jgi:tetratricopeptide (TPR) repeat protein